MDSLPPSSTEREPRPLTFLASALWAIAATLLVVMGVSISEAIRPGAQHDLVTLAGSYVIGYSLVFFAILRVHEPETSIREVLALKNPGILILLLAVAAGAALNPVSGAIDHAITAKLPPTPEATEALERLFAITTPSKRAIMILATAIVIPTCQAVFLHGALFTPLEKHRPVVSVILAIAVFDLLGGSHETPLHALHFVPAVLLFAWLRAMTRSILPALLARIAFFAFEVVPYALGKDLPLSPRVVVVGGVAALVVAVVAIRLLSRRLNETPDAAT